MIQHDKLLEILDYDPSSGIFRWKIQTSNFVKIGEIAGTIGNGYRHIWIQEKPYMASRLAWFYMTKAWPNYEIDHKNQIKLDDRFENLREATPTQNMRNRGLQKNNKTGFKGVMKRKSGRYRAIIRVNKKLRHLGTYDNAIKAAMIYDQAAIGIFGDFARPNLSADFVARAP